MTKPPFTSLGPPGIARRFVPKDRDAPPAKAAVKPDKPKSGAGGAAAKVPKRKKENA